MFQKRTRTDRERLSDAIGQYWATFARDGEPSCPGQPSWPRYLDRDGSYLCLDSDSDGGIRVVDDTDSVDELVADLRADRRIDDAERASIVEEMGDWMFTRPVQAGISAALEPA